MDRPPSLRTPTLRVTPEEACALPNDPGHPSRRVLSHGSLEVRWFVPTAGDRHLPHDRDELYVIVSGQGMFCRANESGAFDEEKLGLFGEERTPVKAGDLLFVPAGTAHEFQDVTPDFAVWAMFYGPEGGEAP